MAGSEEQVATDPSPRKFVVDVSERDQNDLKLRLRLARYPDQINGAGWEYGTGAGIPEGAHDILGRITSAGRSSKHGENSHFTISSCSLEAWMCSLSIIHPKNQEPRRSFSYMAGQEAFLSFRRSSHGWSKGATTTWFAKSDAAEDSEKLYQANTLAGGDWGGDIVFTLGCHHSANCKAIHTNFPIAVPKLRQLGHLSQYINSKLPILNQIPLTMTQRELEGMKRNEWFLDKHRGLAAWLVEKFRSYSDCNGNVETRFSKHELLTMFSLYW
ncbi:hypothetical protein WJX84_001095 [Apatococcus fuscideae]|uniref:Uncharacterized protein n=1 Tax=Apatococcus fuscideae TaxID=2026836 RepID=A0AAW1SW67_9CHLO